MVITISLGAFVADQIKYNLESAQNLREWYYIIYTILIHLSNCMDALIASMLLNIYKI